MKQIHYEILELVCSGKMSYPSLWYKYKKKEDLGKYGMNKWNFVKVLEKLVDLGYLRLISDNNIDWFTLTVKGAKYLNEVKRLSEV